MKIATILFSALMVLSLASLSFAADVQPGTYVMKSDAMQMKIEVINLPGGMQAVNGEGKSATGANCRIGDLGAVQGGNLVLGTCAVPIAFTADGFELQSSPACIQCQPGASIQGIYKKQ